MQADASAHVASAAASSADVRPTVDDLFRCSKGLKLILLRMTRNLDLASDLSQDVLESALHAIQHQRIQSAQALPAYLHTCAKNVVIAHAQRSRRLVLDNDADIACDVTPLDHYEHAELAELARQVLAELPVERDRELIRGFYVLGLSKVELMQSWRLEKDTFDKVLSRARSRMRELMHEKLHVGVRAVSETAPVSLFAKPKAP